MKEIDIPKDRKFIILFAIFALLVNILIFNNYRAEDIDDPWSLSFAYNFLHNDYEYDSVYKTTELGGVAYFGKIYSYFYGFVLDKIGWTKLYGHILSAIFTYLSLFLWYKIFQQIGINKKKIAVILLLMLVFEPYLCIANKTRSDALAYFFSTLCFYLFTKEKYLLSGFTGMLGLETHPLGISGYFYCLAFFIWQNKEYLKDKKKLVKSIIYFFIGIILGSLIYILLHYNALLNIGGELKHAVGTAKSKNYLISYFFYSKKNRHLVEFILFISMSIVYFVRKQYREDKFSIIFLIIVIIQSILLPRGNYNYAVFAFPAFILFSVEVIFFNRKIIPFLLLLFILLFPQYIYLYKMNYREKSNSEYVDIIYNKLPDNKLPVFGSANEWFAFYQRDYFYFYTIDERDEIKECYLIVENDFRKLSQKIPMRFNKRLKIEQFIFNGEKIEIYFLVDEA